MAAAGEVVVDVVAASVNGADWKVRSGQYSQAMFPLVLGRDFSGLVAAVFWSFPSMLIANARAAFTSRLNANEPRVAVQMLSESPS